MTVPDFTLQDQADQPWSLAEHRGVGIVIVTLRGDW